MEVLSFGQLNKLMIIKTKDTKLSARFLVFPCKKMSLLLFTTENNLITFYEQLFEGLLNIKQKVLSVLRASVCGYSKGNKIYGTLAI